MSGLRALLSAAAICLAAVAPAIAQRADPPTAAQSAYDILVTHFYDDPRPERLAGFLDELVKNPLQWSTYPPLVGFFAATLSRHPDGMVPLLPAHFDAKTAETIAVAWRLSARPPMAQSLRSRIDEVGHDPALHAVLADLPSRLEDIRITNPTHLDILWGAFFASGDPRYVRMILDFVGQMANRSENMAVDITKVTMAMSGGSKEILNQVRAKYGDALFRGIVYTSTAEWALMANARQHPIVEKTMTDYIDESRESFAAKSLLSLRASARH
jgi:hypothetical protein